MGDLKMRSNIFASINVTAPTAGYSKGDLVKVEDVVGVIVDDAELGETAVLVYKCEKIVVPKRVGTTAVFAAGDKVYFNGTDKKADIATTSGYTLIGRALEAADASASEVLIDLNGACAA